MIKGLLSVAITIMMNNLVIAADEPWLAPSKQHLETKDVTWRDAKRDDREVPARIYYAADRTTSAPLILFSHGLGGSRAAAEYLGRYLAAHDYVSVHLEHRGSDTNELVKSGKPLVEAAQGIASNVKNAVDRAKDVHFAIDELVAISETDPVLRGRIDTSRIGLAGHSFGANTTMLCVGQQLPSIVSGGDSLVDARIKAAVALSVPVPKRTQKLDEIFANVKVPVMHMTGTLDDSPIGDTSAAQRRLPYDHTAAASQYLITFNGGDHMIFSGRRSNGARVSPDEKFHALINPAVTAFFDAYVKGDATAAKWLHVDNGLKQMLGADAVLEHK